MSKTPFPDRNDEAREIRAELNAENSKSADDGLRALDELAKLSEEESDVEVPPVPDDLRGRWRERFGEAREAQSAPSFGQRLKDALTGKWQAGGLLASMALIVLLFSLNQSGTDIDKPVLRGGGESTAPDVVTVYIGSDQISFVDFKSTRGGGLVLEARDRSNAIEILKGQEIVEAVILDASTMELIPWSGVLGEAQAIEDAEGVLELSEALDDYLETDE